MIDDLFSSTKALEKGLDAAWTRNQVIANNIANADTPGFKASHVEFETLFKQALERLDSADGNAGYTQALDEIEPLIVQDTDSSLRMDGNNVDVETENTELAKNTLYYQTLIEKLNSEFTRLELAINGGK